MKKKTRVPKKDRKMHDVFSEVRKESDKRMQGFLRRMRADANKDMERFIGAQKEDFQDTLKFITEHVLSIQDVVEEIKNTLSTKADQGYVVSLDKRVSILEEVKK